MIDGVGQEEQSSEAISNAWFADGCVWNQSGLLALPGQEEGTVNTNAVHEAARRMHRWVRILGHRMFTGYEVIVENGIQKSVLWFERMHWLDSRLNPWDGIADTIASVAPERGWTNEWMVGVWRKPWKPEDSGSIWDLTTFAERYGPFNPCMWYSPSIGFDAQWLWHVSYGRKLDGCNVLAEAPDGYNYGRLTGGTGWINQETCADAPCEEERLKKIKACRLYEPEDEIESADTVEYENGTRFLRVKLKARMRSTYGEVDGAPETVSKDMATWDRTTIQAEPFATRENSLRLWLLARDRADYNSTLRPGDESFEAGAHGAWPAIVPTFYFVKLIPHPWDDGTDTIDSADTPLYADAFGQMDFYLRAMCEGFVDENSTLNACVISPTDCGDGSHASCSSGFVDKASCQCSDNGYDLYDYTYPNLCLQAFGGSWIGCVGTQQTDYLGADDVREDRPTGFGFLPNTMTVAEVFNNIASAVDLLTRARVMLPWKFETKYTDWTSDPTDAWAADGQGLCGLGAGGLPQCGGTHGNYGTDIRLGGVPPADYSSVVGAWAEDLYGYAYTYGTYGCGAYFWRFASARKVCEYRFSPTHDDYWHAIPELWRTHAQEGRLGTAFCWFEYGFTLALIDGTMNCTGSGDLGCSLVQSPYADATRCAFMLAGTIDLGAKVPTSYYVACSSQVPPGECNGGPGHYVYFLPLAGRSLYVEIPIVEAES